MPGNNNLGGSPMPEIRVSPLVRGILLGAAVAAVSFSANAQEKHFRFFGLPMTSRIPPATESSATLLPAS
jgi:hypothetical protein